MGYGLVEEGTGGQACVTWGVLAESSRRPLGQRLHRLYRRLLDLLTEELPDCLAIEEPFIASNARTAMAVGQAHGVALLAAAERGLPIEGYSPRQVKMAITGSGSADKAQVQQAVLLHLGMREPPPPDDASDALAVALCHLQKVHGMTPAQAGRQRFTTHDRSSAELSKPEADGVVGTFPAERTPQ